MTTDDAYLHVKAALAKIHYVRFWQDAIASRVRGELIPAQGQYHFESIENIRATPETTLLNGTFRLTAKVVLSGVNHDFTMTFSNRKWKTKIQVNH